MAKEAAEVSVFEKVKEIKKEFVSGMKKDFTLKVNQKYIYKQKMSCMYI